jgi:hypothetical protein
VTTDPAPKFFSLLLEKISTLPQGEGEYHRPIRPVTGIELVKPPSTAMCWPLT